MSKKQIIFMQERRGQNLFKREERTKAAYNNFMTKREKEFVAHLFAKAIQKKEKASPNFYMYDSIPAPEEKGIEKMQMERERKHRKEQKKNTHLLKKKVFLRGVIEDIYRIIDMRNLFSDREGFTEEEECIQVIKKMEEIKEGLFTIDKGISLVRNLISNTERVKLYGVPILSILLRRMQYISATNNFCKLLGDMIFVLEQNKRLLLDNSEQLPDIFIENTAGVAFGYIVLLLLRKENLTVFQFLCNSIAQKLTKTQIERAFFSVSAPLLWKMLSVAARGMSITEGKALRKRLAQKISAGLASKSPALVETIHVFQKRCPS